MAVLVPSFLRRGTSRAPFPFVVGMNRSGTTLLRMMLDAHTDLTIPPETHFVPDMIKAAKADGSTPESVLEAMKAHREWGDFEISDEEMLGHFNALPKLKAGPRGPLVLRDLRRASGQAALRREDSHLRPEDEADSARPSRGALLPRDPRRARRCAFGLDRTVRDLTAGDVAKRWQKKVTKAREDSPAARALHGDPLRGPDPRHRAGPSQRLRFLRASVAGRAPHLPRALRRPPSGDGSRAPRRRQVEGAFGRAAPEDPRDDDKAARAQIASSAGESR